ncbi:MAG: radical SAM protein [Alphaproteobacteria bacterium]|nr:radical SAM protein [Alphaproteobacteria bacterium]
MLSFFKERVAKWRGMSTGIKWVYINTTGNACTNRCYMCPLRSFTGKNIRMPMTTYKKTILQLKDMNFSGELHLYAQNEPFLDVNIFEKIDYAHEQLPDAGIALISNFTVLNDEKIEKIIKSPIKYLSCSIYALRSEAYEAICGRDNFKASFINQVKFLKLYAQNPRISFAMYLMNDKHNQEDIDFCEHFIFDIAPIRRADFYETFSFFNTEFTPKKHNKGYINHCIYDRFQIMGDGDVSLCSIDCGSALHVGNLHESTLSELLNSPQAIELRRRMLKDERKDAYCRYCEFGRVENKILYFLPIPQSLRTFLNKRLNPSFRDEHDVLVFSDHEIKNKLVRFNEIFKDGDEKHWIECLEKLRESYYAGKK